MSGRVISGERVLEGSALATRAARVATGLRDLGVGTGDAVALLLRNDLAIFEASRGASLIGAFAVPLNWHLTREEINYILADSGAKVLVAHADLWRRLAGTTPPTLCVLLVETPPEIAVAYGISPQDCAAPRDMVEWTAWMDGFEPAPSAPIETPPVILYTSGTTGRPKGVRRLPIAPEHAAKSAALMSTVFGFSAQARTMITGPMYHAAPNLYGLGMALAGAEVWLAAKFDAEALLAAIARHRLTHLFMVPTMFVRLLRLPLEVRRRYDVSSLRHVVHAAAPCPVEVKRQMIDWWGPILVEFYGSTETGVVSFSTSQDWIAHPGTVGRALAHTDILIVDDAGHPLPQGEIGEIYGRNKAFFDFTYHNDPDKREAVELHGLITSGDLGYMDADGFLYLCDRRKDMVISGGVNIYPAEVEACLLTLPGVQDCAVFGIPDEEFGEALAAVIQLEPGAVLDAASVRHQVRSRLPGYKTPKVVEFAADLPREDSGKIFKRRLRDPYWAGTGRTI